MKYENVDIFTFNSYKSKKESVSDDSETEKNASPKDDLGEVRTETPYKTSHEDQNMEEIKDSAKSDFDLAHIVTPASEEILHSSLSDDLRKDLSDNISNLIPLESDVESDLEPNIESNLEPNIESDIEPNIESDIFSESDNTVFKSTFFSKTASLHNSLSNNNSLSLSDLSLEAEVLGSSGKEVFPFENFEGEDNILKASPTSEAFGIVTTGIEPLELTPSGAIITGYITSARRDEIRLGTYVVMPYENGEKLFSKVGKLQYRQEFVVDDATELHSRRMLSSRGNPVNEDDYKFLACLDPLCILYRKNEGTLTRRMADRIPRPNTPILPVTDRLEVQTGLNIPEEGIFIGHLSVGGELVKTHSEPETVAYYLRNDYNMGDPLIFRHMFKIALNR